MAIARETDCLYQQLSTPWGFTPDILTHHILTLRFITVAKYSYGVSVKQFYGWGSPHHKGHNIKKAENNCFRG